MTEKNNKENHDEKTGIRNTEKHGEKDEASGKDRKEKQKLKAGKDWIQGRRKADNFHNARAPKKNPLITIHEQHQGHRFRVAAITVVIFVVIIVGIGIFRYLEYKKNKGEMTGKINAVVTDIEKIDAKIAGEQGYNKFKLAMQAVDKLDKLKRLDPLNRDKWVKSAGKYLELLERGKPVAGQNHVVPTVAIDLAYVPRGRFLMGRKQREPGGDADELPQRPVQIPYHFWMGRMEISFAQFRRLYPFFNIKAWNGYKLDADLQPAAKVNWHTAAEYCEMLTSMERKAERLPHRYVYRLPTEAEWEYACRAGTQTHYFWGDTFSVEGAKFANTLDAASWMIFWDEKLKEPDVTQDDGFRVSSPVGSFAPNAFGLYDCSGNVWEWCWDWYNPHAYRDLTPKSPVQREPVVVTLEKRGSYNRRYTVEATSRVIRGGSWYNPPGECRSAARDSLEPDTENTGVGFRIVLAPLVEDLGEDFIP